jgi:protease I
MKNFSCIEYNLLEGLKVMEKEIMVLSFLHDDFEDLEVWYPVLRLMEEGITVHLVGEESNKKYIGKYGVPAVSLFSFKEIDYSEYDAILIPRGWAPDKLRRFPEVIEIVKFMNKNKRPIGYICHAGWVPVSAGILKGRKVTSTPGIKDDIINAGGEWLDLPVVVDGNIVSSRKPLDLPFYMKEFINLLVKS